MIPDVDLSPVIDFVDGKRPGEVTIIGVRILRRAADALEGVVVRG